MKYKWIWSFILMLCKLKSSFSTQDIWEMTSKNTLIFPSNDATSFSSFNGELAYVIDKKFYVEGKVYDVNFNSIQSYLKTGNSYFVCPNDENAKVTKINIGTKTQIDIALPFTSENSDTWHLKCVQYLSYPIILVGFLGCHNIYAFNFETEKWLDGEHGIFDEDKLVLEFDCNDKYLFIFDVLSEHQKNYIRFEYFDFTYSNGLFSLVFEKELHSPEILYTDGDDFHAGFESTDKKIIGVFSSSSFKYQKLVFKFDFENQRDETYQLNVHLENFFTISQCYINECFFYGGTSIMIYKHENTFNCWGMFDPFDESLIFNREESIDGIYPINDISGRNKGFIIKKGSEFYQICPFSNSQDDIKACLACPNGEKLIIDSKTGNRCFSISSNDQSLFNFYGDLFAKCKDNKIFVQSNTCDQSYSQLMKVPDGIFVSNQECTDSNSEINQQKNVCRNCHHYREFYDNGACKALPDGYYANENNEKVQCDTSCKTCDDENSCTTCSNGKVLDKDTGFCVVDNQTETKVECYYLCSTCTSKGNEDAHKCEGCKDGSTPVSGNCPVTCSGLWYTDQIKKCVNSCPTGKKYIIQSTNECVSDCASENLFLHNNKCLANCPSGYDKNLSTYTCDLHQEHNDNDKKNEEDNKKGDEDGCILKLTHDPYLKPDNKIKENSEIKLQEFILNIESNKEVEIIFGDGISLLLYQDIFCAYKYSLANNILFANLTDITDKIADDNSIPRNSTFSFVEAGISRGNSSLTEQISGFIIADAKGNSYPLEDYEDEKVEVSYPLPADAESIEEAEKMDKVGVDIYNPEDPFFNNFCYPYYTEDNLDVTLGDRRKDYFKNYSFCEEGCDYKKIDFKTARVSCSCTMSSNFVDKINDNNILPDFPVELNYNNLIVVRCYNLVFDSHYILINYCGWIIIVFFLIQIGAIITFTTGNYKLLNSFLFNKIKEKEKEKFDTSNKTKKDSIALTKGNPPRRSSVINNFTAEGSSKETTMGDKCSSPSLSTFSVRKTSCNNHSSSTSKLALNDVSETSSIRKGTFRNNSGSIILASTKGSKKEVMTEKIEESFSAEELNKLDYEDAKIYDNRSIFAFYCNILINTLSFTSSCSSLSPLEPVQIRLIGLLLILTFYIVINALFYDEEYVSKRYNFKETGFMYIIRNELEKSVYASICTCVVGFLIDYATSFRKRFEKIFNEKRTEREYIQQSSEAIKKMKIRIWIFYVDVLILMLMFWYYVSAFCSVYQNNKAPLLEGCLITFFFCTIWQIVLAFLITLIRYIGLKCNISCLYTLSTYFT